MLKFASGSVLGAVLGAFLVTGLPYIIGGYRMGQVELARQRGL